jgi:hypothetical protein
MTAPIHGGFTYGQMQDLLKRACTAVGLDATGAQLMRGQTNAVIRLASEPIVVKIARNGTNPQEVHRTVGLVRWLMDLGFPTVPLHRPETQPIVIDGHPVTLWTYLPQPGYPVPAGAIAKPLDVLHSLSKPPVALEQLDVCAAIRRSLDNTTTLRQGELDFLNDRLRSLRQALTEVTYELESAVLQGDPQHGNALHDRERAVLCDWDSVALGQPEWDLVTIEVHCRRFGYGAQHYNQFAEAYGWDVTGWPGYPVLRDLRELRMITTNARKATHEPAKLLEVQRRIKGLRRGDLGLRWNIL